MSERQLSEAPLRVSSELREAALASPLRRFLALTLDFLLMVPPSFAVATGAALLALRLQDPAAFAALPAVFAHEPTRPASDAALAAIAPVLVHRRLPPHPRLPGVVDPRPLARPQPPHGPRPRGAHGGHPRRATASYCPSAGDEDGERGRGGRSANPGSRGTARRRLRTGAEGR